MKIVNLLRGEKMNLTEAIREVWMAIDDLESLASTLEPEDQLDENEIAELGAGATRADRYDLTGAHRVISTAFDRAIALSCHVRELIDTGIIVDFDDDLVENPGSAVFPQVATDTRLLLDLFTEAFDGYHPDPADVDCPGCPCTWQGGSPCCECGQDIGVHP